MFIAMEYIEGRTLEQLIPQKGLRFADALRYAIPAADALAAAHAIGIVHRDVKPSNIMVSAKGVVKVLDFGLAKLTSRGTPRSAAAGAEADATVTVNLRDTEAGSILGTVAYMSPEQAEGKEIDARSDIFSFGVMLYEMLTGRRPFTGDTKLSTLAAIVNQEPRPARQLVEVLPSELDRVLARCLRQRSSAAFPAHGGSESCPGRIEGGIGFRTPHGRRARARAEAHVAMGCGRRRHRACADRCMALAKTCVHPAGDARACDHLPRLGVVSQLLPRRQADRVQLERRERG